MKEKPYFFRSFLLTAGIISGSFMIQSCGQKSISQDMIGEWKSEKSLITVRVKDKKTRFQFFSDSAIILLKINDDNSVYGSIGSAKFEDGKIKPNRLLPVKMSGLSYTIECGKIGKIFDKDPLTFKEVELWISPGPANGRTEAELRYTQGAHYFPMSGFFLIKLNQ